MRANTLPPSFADLTLRSPKRTRSEAFLERVNGIVDFSFTDAWHEELYTSDRGRKPFEARVMFKVLLLQQWFGLSDPEAEEQIHDRRSFQHFLGITADTDIPDETTICRFRTRLVERKLDGAFFAEVHRQLTAHDLRVRRGKIVDATICEVPRGRRRGDGTSTRDEDAAFTRKGNRTYHGYKAHVATDTRGRFIETCVTSPANHHDSQHFDALVDGTEPAVFGDSAYVNTERKEAYRQQGKVYGIVERGVRGHPLSGTQRRRNRRKSTVRARGEHPFAELKRRMKFRLRYRGFRKVEWQVTMACAAYNLKRFVGILEPAQAQAVVWRR